MSIANIERFYQKALRNPEIVRELQLATDANSFASMAVALGEKHGCRFRAEEIGEWIRMKFAELEEECAESAS
ncbi:MAG: Nif11 family protein [Burkholderiales bacterium]|nr:Nif11 family protein [Burkholderiales bacterium]